MMQKKWSMWIHQLWSATISTIPENDNLFNIFNRYEPQIEQLLPCKLEENR